MLNIQGFTKTTLLDYPGKVAATIFFGGCNFRCPFCHNSPLVLCPEREPSYIIEDILTTLAKRRGILDGVCISGGEPTLDPGLPGLCEEIKALGYLVKIDTNGTNPSLLQELAGERLVDYVAMDIKASPSHYPELAGIPNPDMDKILRTAQWLLSGALPYEFRTTVVRELHTEDDFREISRWLAGAGSYYLQAYKDSPNIMCPGYTCCTKKEMEHYLDILRVSIPSAQLRGID